MERLHALFLSHTSQLLSSIPRERCFSAIRYSVDFSCIDRTSSRHVLLHRPGSRRKSPLNDQLGKTASIQRPQGVIGPRSEATPPSSFRTRIPRTLLRDQGADCRNPNASDASSIRRSEHQKRTIDQRLTTFQELLLCPNATKSVSDATSGRHI